MSRLLSFLIRLAVFIAVAVWLADRPGTARIIWHGYVIETSAAFLGLCGLALGFAFYLLFRFWNLLKNGPEQWRLHRKLKKIRAGQNQVASGLVAIASGNAAEAGRLAVQARKSLGVTPVTQLLQAQAAQLAGDHGTARDIFRAMTADTTTAMLGYRGLIMEARRDNNWAEVNHLTDRVRHLKLDAPWLDVVRFEILARQQDWREADTALSKAMAAHLVDSSRAKQNRAALLVAQSQNDARLAIMDKALQEAEQAIRLAPNWVPAILNLAQRQINAEQRRAAHRTIEKHWERTPHPQLAAAYRLGNADPLEAYKQLEKLCRSNETAPASRLALGEAAVAADIWGEARRHLIALVSNGHATQAVYRLLARLERRENGDERAAMQWLAKAGEAPADPTWLCAACGGAHMDWQATCRHCGSFNSLHWQSAGQHRTTAHEPSLLAQSMVD